MSRRTTGVLIFCFIVSQPLHDGHDNPFTLVFTLNDFVSYAFLYVLLLFVCRSILTLDWSTGPESSYLL